MVASNGLSPHALRETVLTFRDLLRSHQELVNRLNVYPVPDGDTGTNMALTLESVARELEGAEPSMVAICKAISHGSLMGARGNSGVILSQLLRGLAERFTLVEEITAEVLADALANADALAREAVVRPVEGTILTVARAAAEGAAAAVAREDDFSGVVLGAHRAAAEALEETPELLPQLKQAGVVDAGGAGFLLLLDALRHIVDDIALPQAPASTDHLPPLIEHGETSALEELRYEVMYLLEAPDETIKAFKEVWAGIGDSIVVVGGDGIFNCHIHTDDIGAAIEAALDCGRPREIRITDLHEQVVEERWVREHEVTEEESVSEEGHTSSVIAVVTGDGVGRIFRSLGVSAQVRGGQSMNPSTEQLLEAVEALAAREVIILPNNKNIRAVAEQLDELTDKTVRVVPTNSIVEGFAALLAYDPDSGADDNASAMLSSASNVLAAEVTRAVRATVVDAGEIHEGDWIGLGRGEIISIADSLCAATCELIRLMLDESHHELVTLIEGEGSSAGDTRLISEWLHEEYADIAVEVHHGGQPLYPYLIGIE